MPEASGFENCLEAVRTFTSAHQAAGDAAGDAADSQNCCCSNRGKCLLRCGLLLLLIVDYVTDVAAYFELEAEQPPTRTSMSGAVTNCSASVYDLEIVSALRFFYMFFLVQSSALLLSEALLLSLEAHYDLIPKKESFAQRRTMQLLMSSMVVLLEDLPLSVILMLYVMQFPCASRENPWLIIMSNFVSGVSVFVQMFLRLPEFRVKKTEKTEKTKGLFRKLTAALCILLLIFQCVVIGKSCALLLA